MSVRDPAPTAAGRSLAADVPAHALVRTTSGSEHPLVWVELTPDYRCNNRCVGCFSVSDSGPSMTPSEIARALTEGRRRGASSLWLGGGEPTLRRELAAIVREGKRLGYTRIRLQTNGMMLAYEAFVTRLVEAGLTEVSFSLKGPTADVHDAYAGTPGTFELLEKGIANALATGLSLEADVLVYASNAALVPGTIRGFHARGIARFRLWCFSAASSHDASLVSEVPRASDVVARLVEAMDMRLSDDPEWIVSLHTPPCTIPPSHRSASFDPAAYGLLVVNPGGHSFRLEESPMEGGTYLEGCAACAYRARCGGIRAESLALHGPAPYVPIVSES